VRTKVDLRLVDEARRFALRFACEDCAHFVTPPPGAPLPKAPLSPADGRCAHGYPLAPRRDAMAAADISFCKEFDVA